MAFVPSPQFAAIAELISETSEEFWSASWLHDCEYSLWALVQQYRRTGKCSAWGMSSWRDTTAVVKRLSDLSEETLSWAYWKDSDGYTGAVGISLSEWETSLWPKAAMHYRDLAASEPTCGEFGPMVPYENLTFSYFSSCELPADHEGNHDFRDNAGHLVVDDKSTEPELEFPTSMEPTPITEVASPENAEQIGDTDVTEQAVPNPGLDDEEYLASMNGVLSHSETSEEDTQEFNETEEDVAGALADLNALIESVNTEHSEDPSSGVAAIVVEIPNREVSLEDDALTEQFISPVAFETPNDEVAVDLDAFEAADALDTRVVGVEIQWIEVVEPETVETRSGPADTDVVPPLLDDHDDEPAVVEDETLLSSIVSVEPCVWIDPTRLSGEPCIGGTRLSVSFVADQYRWFGMDAVTSDYGLTRSHVLVACWYLGINGCGPVSATPKKPKKKKDSDPKSSSEPEREWRDWWGDWAESATPALHLADYDAVTDPPLKKKWKR